MVEETKMKIRNLYLEDPDEQIVYTENRKPQDHKPGIVIEGIVYCRDVIINPPSKMEPGDMYIPAPTKIICEDIYLNGEYDE